MGSIQQINPYTEIVVVYTPCVIDELHYYESFMQRYRKERAESDKVPERIGDPIVTKLINEVGLDSIGENVKVVVYSNELKEHVRFDTNGIPFIDHNAYVIAKLLKVTINSMEVPSSMVLTRLTKVKALEKQAKWL